MIVRYALKCDTCERAHTVRIGMGQEASQLHNFPCRKCNENIALRLEVDFKNTGWRVVCVENCKPIEEEADAEIVNVDANFLIRPDLQGKDGTFNRLEQMGELVKGIDPSKLVDISKLTLEQKLFRPHRQPDYAEEWKALRKAWSLLRNNVPEIAAEKLREGSSEFYQSDPPNDISDWLWRLSFLILPEDYRRRFVNIIGNVRTLKDANTLDALSKVYGPTAEARGKRYFTALSEFYDAYSEFAQVYLYIYRGIELPQGYQTTSTGFDSVKMFYGNTYEHFTSLVEILALLNNCLSGRAPDEFERLSLEQYRALDKSSRFGPFSSNTSFMSICSEADNQIRNASHHGSFDFDRKTQTITYRSGKGGTGPEQQITYASYLERSIHLFLQLSTLLKLELILSNHLGIRHPI